MSDSKKSRREFLGVAGATLAGAVIASATLNLPIAMAGSPTAIQADSLEAWLLDTGQQALNPELFTAVREKIG